MGPGVRAEPDAARWEQEALSRSTGWTGRSTRSWPACGSSPKRMDLVRWTSPRSSRRCRGARADPAPPPARADLPERRWWRWGRRRCCGGYSATCWRTPRSTRRPAAIDIYGWRQRPAFLAVTDDGPGIPEEWRDQIFEPFVRLDDSPRGAGIGFSRHGTWRAMGGDLRAEPRVPAGDSSCWSWPVPRRGQWRAGAACCRETVATRQTGEGPGQTASRPRAPAASARSPLSRVPARKGGYQGW